AAVIGNVLLLWVEFASGSFYNLFRFYFTITFLLPLKNAIRKRFLSNIVYDCTIILAGKKENVIYRLSDIVGLKAIVVNTYNE
ncbi:MAG TPA: hypothetical protein PLH07_09765, partial [Sulfurovum sp.]|nr:hypothetical protein [Sulfurovum sp.]HQS73475.1 hypothetical protein [Sulfurovum sp.]HQS78212.1 hypothetical protein [Sulfurovum sp.]HQT29569.1 hypothetical protein [Sulfurovum sp.]